MRGPGAVDSAGAPAGRTARLPDRALPPARRTPWASAVLVVLAACTVQREVSLTFGTEGEGLDGFMCRDPQGQFLLDRARDGDGGVRPGALVFDFVRLGGVPGCRTGQLVKWCSTRECKPLRQARACVPGVTLPTVTPMMKREDLRAAVLSALKQVRSTGVLDDAPDEFVIVRAVGTLQSCEALTAKPEDVELPGFDKAELLGCAYSCPVLLDRVDQDVYLGFETLTVQCEQGVRICSDGQLQWQP
ncbi:MAG: hypothetical protein MUC96_04295 [Myxococcaceae bacterium]|nr:hypothetical protein [Myxococcaceae bacterium]